MQEPFDTNRASAHSIEPLILNRWSPRAMSGEETSDEERLRLFEAARWAPSTMNEQEWRFLYATRNTPAWQTHFDLLVDANQVWCKNAAMLVVIASKKTFTRGGEPNPVHLFDCGNAFENLALQGVAMGLVVHGMAGFDYDKARTSLRIPDDYDVAAMFAVGRPGDPSDLPEKLRAREKPSDRKPIDQIICEGAFEFPV
jgi:nitroreductase